MTAPRVSIATVDLEAWIAESEDACAAMLAQLIAGNDRMLADLQAFRVETRAGFVAIHATFDSTEAGVGTLEASLDSFGAALTRTGEMVDEILRRISGPDSDRQD